MTERPELLAPSDWEVVHEAGGGFRVETSGERWARECTAIVGKHVAAMLSLPDVSWFKLEAPR